MSTSGKHRASARSSTPWVYRNRKLLFGAAYVGAFALGAAADACLRNGPPVPAYLALGNVSAALGARAMLAIALCLTGAGFALRVWGSAYLRAGTVWNSDILTGSLHVGGPFRYTRNPLYLGTIVLSAGVGMLGSLPALGFLIAGNVALCQALARAEERNLRTAYGERYDAYARRVPRFVPALQHAPLAGQEQASLGAGLATELWTSGFVLAMLDAFVTQRPGTPAFWLLLASGPLLGAAARSRHRGAR